MEPMPFPRNTSKQTIAMERSAESALHFVYYRRFPVSQKICSDFFQENDSLLSKRGNAAATSIPPPPPPPPSVDDYSISLTCRQNPMDSESARGTLDDYNQEDEEEAGVASGSYGDDDIRSTGTPHTQQTGHNSALSAYSAASSTACFVLKAPSQCAELLGWGQNVFSSLGIDDDAPSRGARDDGAAAEAALNTDSSQNGQFYHPRPIPIPASLAMERIKMIACSPRHTLFLTVLGNIYCCGENSEGALGLGDLKSRSNVSLLSWPTDPNAPLAPPPRITKVAAGSGSIGSHSMAIDTDGRLYGWGVPYAVGHGGIKPAMLPTLINTFPSSSDVPVSDRFSVEGSQDATPPGAVLEDDNDDTTLLALRCKDVSCGGGFTVVVTHSGLVYSWGSFLFGKLGTGSTPSIKSGLRRGGGTKLARYQLRPALVKGLPRAESVSCGEAHVLCLTSCGELYSWGQNSCGQLGVGVTSSGFLRNSSRPVRITAFGPHTPYRPDQEKAHHSHRSDPICRTICCGAYHSIAIDTKGRVWTWGARGTSCLGHNDPLVEGAWAEKINGIFSIAQSGHHVMVPFELLEWCRMWSVPRRVPGLAGCDASQIAAGDLHTAIVTSRGYLYLWGTGGAAPPLASASLRVREGRAADDAAEWDDGNIASETDSLLSPNQSEASQRRNLRRAERILSKATIISTPRRPSASWLGELSTKRTLLVSSSGSRCFVLQDEETVAASLTGPLLRQTIFGTPIDHDDPYRHANEAAADVADDTSVDSYLRSDDGSGSVGSYFATRGRADCMVLASGKVLLAHRALLSARSSELRDMIIQEMPTHDYSGPMQPIQLLLPELHADAAKALVAFLYTDVLPQSCIGNVSLLRSLARAGQNLRLPRLQVICDRLLSALSTAEQATERSEDLLKTMRRDGGVGLGLDMPPPTLARDLGSLVGDQQFADIRFVAEGRAVLAHRFLLEARCEYFRAMFRSGMSEGQDAGKVDVVVPDTFVGFLRLLIFIYTDTLPDGSDGALLEDLMSADRYNMPDMRRLCESMLVPSEANWLDLLQAADIVNSPVLRDEVEGFLRDNFAVLNRTDHPALDGDKSTVAVLRESFPGTLDRIFESRRVSYPTPPIHSLSTRVTSNTEAVEKKQLHNRPFPLWAAGGVVVCLLGYAQVQRILILGYTVPIVNIIVLCVVVLYLSRGLVVSALRGD